jgi:hypothetical protein
MPRWRGCRAGAESMRMHAPSSFQRFALVGALLVAAPTLAQVTATQAPTPLPEQLTEICPLQLDFDMTKSAEGGTFIRAPEGASLSTSSTSRFVCDKARVQSITVTKEKDRPREVLLTVSALLSSSWMRQDVDLTVSLLVNGEVKKSEQYRSLTIGDPNTNWASRNVSFAGSSSKTRGIRVWVKRSDFNAWFGEGSKPSVRVVMAVVDDDDEEENEVEEEEGGR